MFGAPQKSLCKQEKRLNRISYAIVTDIVNGLHFTGRTGEVGAVETRRNGRIAAIHDVEKINNGFRNTLL